MVIDTLLLAVGTATAKAVARIWIKGDAATDLSEHLIEQLAGRVPGIMERRRASRQFQEMADRVAQQLEPLIHNDGGLPANEREAAILGVAEVIESLQAMNADLLFSIDMEPTALEALLRQDDSMHVRSDLIAPAQLLFDVLLRESSNYIVELTIAMPQFASAALVEMLRRGSEIMERVDAALDRLPKPALAQADADQEFEVRYRRHMARELDRLELFGLALSDSSARYALSIAYITLGASIGGDEAEDPVVTTGGNIGKDETVPGSGGDGDAEVYVRVDDALARGQRHFIRGEAGSGKTTLLQWLAVTASRQQFEGSLADWKGLVPFFIQLRRYANGPLPNPSQFLDHTAALIAGVMPPSWVDRKLMAGEGLLLIDGVDELPEHQRQEARDWLNQLLAEYPSCRFVVTTRPPAVPENWLDASAFHLFELLPMSLPDIESFVQHWYDAARSAVTHDHYETELLERYQRELTQVMRENSSIRSLATAPLLCAMLCALNRDRRTQLPKDRMELYRIALETLLDRRDVEREISRHDSVTLGLREKEALLQDLAYWLILNEQTDVPKAAAIEHMETRLAFMTSISSSASEVFRHLLTRSGIIREPVEGRIDFIHRTFQEYLGAARAMKEGSIPYLVARAHDDQWREVVILSAGHASAAQANQLIDGLIDRGVAETDYKHRLHLLAVACLETAVELEPQTIARVEKALRGALPPTNMTEARAVASAGPVAAPLLAQYRRGYATTVAACVRALCLIGGEAALSALHEISTDRRVTVTRELIRGWEYFDRDTYASQVLAGCALDNGRIEVSDADSLGAVHHLRQLRHLTFAYRGSHQTFEALPNLDLITDLVISDASHFDSLEPLAGCARLQTLNVSFGSGPTSVPRLSEDLTSLRLLSLNNLRDVSSLKHQPNLATLVIEACPVNADDLTGCGASSLQLIGVAKFGDGVWLSTLPNLSDLVLSSADSEPLQLGLNGSCGYLGSGRLERLSVFNAGSLVSLDGLGDPLRDLFLVDASRLEDASALSAVHDLQMLTIDGARLLGDFSFLPSATRATTHLDLEHAKKFADLGLLEGSRRLQFVNIADTSVRDLTPLVGAPLRSLNVAHCPIESLEPLLGVDSRCLITIDPAQRRLLSPALQERRRWRVTMA